MGGWGLDRGNKVKVRSLAWALIKCDWCPYKKGEFRPRNNHRQRRDIERWPFICGREKPDIDPTFTVLRRSQHCQHFNFRLHASRTVRKYVSIV